MSNKKSHIKMNLLALDNFIWNKKSQIKTHSLRSASFGAFICDRKSQIKMMETISVLLVFMIIIVFVMIFYVNISSSSASLAKEDEANLKAVEISQKISFMPEFQCASKNIITDNCFDILKLDGFNNYVTNDIDGQISYNTTYFDMFENSKIVVAKIYPATGDIWEIYDRKPSTRKYGGKTTFIPISLYDPNVNEWYFGLLNVTVYS